MRPFPRPTFTARITFLVGSGILLATVCCAVVFAQLRQGDMRGAGEERLRVAISAFLAVHGGRTVGEDAGGAIELDERQMDALSAGLGRFGDVDVAVFRRDPESGAFVRAAPLGRGTDEVPTGMELQGLALAAIEAGRTHEGFGTDASRLSLFVPVVSSKGVVIGAVGGAVSHPTMVAALWDILPRLVIPMLILLGAAAVCGRFIVRRALEPVDRVAAFLDRLAQGDRGAGVAGLGAHGDFTDLARACETLDRTLRADALRAEGDALSRMERERGGQTVLMALEALRAGLDRVAAGDLAILLPDAPEGRFPPEHEGLRQSFHGVVDRIRNVIGRVGQIAGGLRDSAGEMAGASRELSARAETQAATLEQSAAALTELTQSVASTAERAGKAQEAGFANRSVAERGAGIVQDAVAAMQEIERGSEQITRIIGVIDEIAFQTNLLALNAGVEAVRAGEAGRGFAVVASEVRLLAQRASESAREIKGLISASKQRVGQGSALVRRAGESLADIVQRADEAAGLVAGIAHAAAEQARGLSEVASAINQLDHVTQQNSAMAEETSAAAATLQARAEDLILALGQFRTGSRTEVLPVQPELPIEGMPVVEARIVDWAPAVKAATNARKANRTAPNAVWAEF